MDIVTTLREPLPLTLAYVAHQLAQGVARLHLYFDDPDDPALGLLARVPQVRATGCGARYWAARGGRPGVIVARQVANAQDCQQHTTAPWLLHCDADEFLIDGGRVLRALDRAHGDTQVVRLPVWERCFVAGTPEEGLFDGYCRGPVLAPKTVYGADARSLSRGMAAYAGCKSATRMGSGLGISIHDSFRIGREGEIDRILPLRRKVMTGPQIVHVDGLTAYHAAVKMVARGQEIPVARRAEIMSPARRAQIRELSGPLADADAHFHALRRLSATTAESLIARHALMLMPVNPAAAAIARWPDVAPLFEPKTFDRLLELRQKRAVRGAA